MSRIEKLLIIFYWVYIAIYVPVFFAEALFLHLDAMPYLLPFHFLGMLMGFGVLFCVIRDVLDREFPDSNTKVVWMIAIVAFWPAMLLYLYRHGFRERATMSPKNVG